MLPLKRETEYSGSDTKPDDNQLDDVLSGMMMQLDR